MASEEATSDRPRLYTDLAGWFHLLTAPHEYREEAEYSIERILEAASGPVRTVLELGSGGGNNAVHMKRQFEMTLSDLSAEMLEVSRGINPEIRHVQGDMCSLRIDGPKFDAVFVHDAVGYLTTEDDVRAMAATAAYHCWPGGAVLVLPDHVSELFTPPYTEHGGPRWAGRERPALPHVGHGPGSLGLHLPGGLRISAAQPRRHGQR